MSRRGLSETQIDRVIRALVRRLETVHKGNNSALAREVGVAQSSLWDIINRVHPPSRATAESVARLEGVSVESLLASPRERAAGIAREGGIPESAIAAVLAEPDHDDRTVLAWIDRMRAAAVLADRGAA